MEDHVNRFLNVSHKLNSIGFKMKMKMNMLASLPGKYEPLISGDSVKPKTSEHSDDTFCSSKN